MNKNLLDEFNRGLDNRRQDGGVSARLQREPNDVNDINLQKLLINDVNDEHKLEQEYQENQEDQKNAQQTMIAMNEVSYGDFLNWPQPLSGSRLDTSSNKPSTGRQKLMNFNVVQKMCQRNQMYNDKKKDEILEEQLQQINEDEQMPPAVILDNPYQDINKIISKAKSQQKVPQMKKAKSTYSAGSGNKILKPESSFVGDNEPFNVKIGFGFHDTSNAFQSNQNTYKTMFQVKK